MRPSTNLRGCEKYKVVTVFGMYHRACLTSCRLVATLSSVLYLEGFYPWKGAFILYTDWLTNGRELLPAIPMGFPCEIELGMKRPYNCYDVRCLGANMTNFSPPAIE